MAHPLSDEFTLPISGTVYRFRFGLREVIDLQERLIDGDAVPSIQDIDRGVRVGRLRYVRALLWAGLRQYHPTMTEEAVTDSMAGASEAELQAVLKAFGYSMTPDPADIEALGSAPDANPQTAQDGVTTGEDSTSTVGAVA